MKNGVELFFCVFSALINVKLCETSFWVKKVVGKFFFQKLKFLPYKGIRTCKNFWKMGLKNVFAFFRLSPYMGIRTCKNVWKMWLKNVFAFFRLLPYMGIRTCKNFWKMGLKFFFCVFSALINVKLCETCFLSKKSCRKIFFFKNWNFYPIGGSELVKVFEKLGWKMFLSFLGFYPIWGSELVKIYEKWGWNFFLRFSALINVKLCETCFLSKKSCRKISFSKIETLTL